MYDRIWTAPRLQTIRLLALVRLLTSIRSLTTAPFSLLGQDHNGLFARQFPIAFLASGAWVILGVYRRRFDLFAVKRFALQSL